MHNVAGAVYLSMVVDGREVDFETVPLHYLVIRSHRLYLVPTLEVAFTDQSGFFDASPINDASVIEVLLCKQASDPARWRKFKVFKVSPSKNRGAVSYSVTAVMNVPAFFNNKEAKAYRGNSSDVVKAVCAEYGVTCSVDPTSDSQVWRRASSTAAEFLTKEVVAHGWVGPKSWMGYYYSPDSGVRYRDLSSVILQPARRSLSNLSNDSAADHAIFEYLSNVESGVGNRRGGYGQRSVTYSLAEGDDVVSSGVSTSKVTSALNLDKSQLGSVTERVFTPIEIGNNSASYHRARAQNRRIDALFSTHVDVLLKDYSDLDGFDPVEVRISGDTATDSPDPEQSGKYLVVGKAQVVTPTQYVEKICLIRNGSNDPSPRLA